MAVVLSMVETPRTLDADPGSDDTIFSRRDARLCSALLRNPGFINTWMTFIFQKAPVQPGEKLHLTGMTALELFILLLGKDFDVHDLDFECEPDLPPGRGVLKL